MNIKSFLLLYLGCIAPTLIVISCGSTKHIVAKRAPFASTPIVIDGDDKDWPSPYPNYDSKAMISYVVSNDRDNLYLSVKANDQRMRTKILRGGMKVWIDTTGNKDEYMFIQSPVADAIPQNSDEEQWRKRNNMDADAALRPDQSTRRKQMMLGAEQYSLSGFGTCDGKYTDNNTSNPCGIQVKLGINEYNELVWEAAIPFTAWQHHPLGMRDAGKPIGICFEVDGIKMPARTTGATGGTHMSGGGMRQGGMGRGGGGGRMGGGQHGGMQNGNSTQEATPISQTTHTWIKAGLAYQ